VTLTSTYTSTDPSGNIIVQTVATVSTPSPDPSQASGGPNPALIGGVVGGVVGAIALIGIIWYILYNKFSGHWDETWDEDEGDHAGAAEIKPARPSAGNDGSVPNPYVYGVVGGGTSHRTDQLSAAPSHSRSASTVTGYTDHARSNSQTPLMMAASPPHSPPNSPPSLQQQQLPGVGGGLDRTRTPIWASPSAQQGYFQQGYPPISDFTPTLNVNSTYSATSRATSATASSTQGLLSGYIPPPHTHTAANPAAAYPPGAAPPAIGGGKRNTYIEYHKPPLEHSQHDAGRPTSQRSQAGSSKTNLVDAPVDNSAVSKLVLAAGLVSDKKENPRRTSLISVASGAPKALNHQPIAEDAPPAYQQ